MEIGAMLAVYSPQDFEEWLKVHGADMKEIWLVIYKKASGKQTVTYGELVEVALCYGWIDGQSKSIDSETYAQRLTPRRKRSHWTEGNKTLAGA